MDVSSASCPIPQPSGVSIDPQLNFAAVTLFGCNHLALINMATGTGSLVRVGANPIGVAVIPRLRVAVVANNGGNGTASIVDEVQHIRDADRFDGFRVRLARLPTRPPARWRSPTAWPTPLRW